MRGNMYSLGHTKLSHQKDLAYWDFSMNEKGIFDIPAMIDYILLQTGTKKLHYIGHSEGSSVFVVMGSKKPVYNNKIKTATLLAPGVYMNQSDSIVIKLWKIPTMYALIQVICPSSSNIVFI